MGSLQGFFTRPGNHGFMRIALAFLLAGVLAGAVPNPGAQASIDMQRSKLTVYVYKQGLFSFLADNHVIDAPIASGSYDAAHKSVHVSVDAAKMRVLDPSMPADRRSQVQANMLGPQVLDVQQYPTIEFQSTSIDDKNGTLAVTGNLTLHGQTHQVSFEAKSSGNEFTGSAMVRQTSYGIKPIKIAGGAVSVKDDVRVQFDIVTR